MNFIVSSFSHLQFSPREPATRPCRLDELVVISAQTGDEYEDTRQLVETYILPLLRAHRVRYVQVARKDAVEADGIVVLDDTDVPMRLSTSRNYAPAAH